jgi:hypothetical protein
MRKHIHRRVRIRRQGLQAAADVHADIAVNISRSESGASRQTPPEEARERDDSPDRPPSDTEGGER